MNKKIESEKIKRNKNKPFFLHLICTKCIFHCLVVHQLNPVLVFDYTKDL